MISRLTDLGLREMRQTTNNVARSLKRQVDETAEEEARVQTKLVRLREIEGFILFVADMLEDEIQRRADEE